MTYHDAVQLECGCVLPGEPCDELERLAREKSVAYARVLDTDEDLAGARTAYAREQARAEAVRAREAYERLRKQYRKHRTGPTKRAT